MKETGLKPPLVAAADADEARAARLKTQTSVLISAQSLFSSYFGYVLRFGNEKVPAIISIATETGVRRSFFEDGDEDSQDDRRRATYQISRPLRFHIISCLEVGFGNLLVIDLLASSPRETPIDSCQHSRVLFVVFTFTELSLFHSLELR